MEHLAHTLFTMLYQHWHTPTGHTICSCCVGMLRFTRMKNVASSSNLKRVRGGNVAPDPVEPLQKLWAKRNRTARVRVYRRRHRRSVTPVPARKRQFC